MAGLVRAAAIVVGVLALGQPTILALAAEERPVPVMLESKDDLDPCAVGRVAGLKPVAGNTLSVRAGPGRAYREIDRLPPGRTFSLCDYRKGWHGIIYGPPGADCPLPADLKKPRPYQGSCRSGWVSEEYVEVTAG